MKMNQEHDGYSAQGPSAQPTVTPDVGTTAVRPTAAPGYPEQTYQCEAGHTFNAVAHSQFDGAPLHCPECGSKKLAVADEDSLTAPGGEVRQDVAMNNLYKHLTPAHLDDIVRIRLATPPIRRFSAIEVEHLWEAFSKEYEAGWLGVTAETLTHFNEWLAK